ncbi:proton channel OtopLc-like isoform X1 [Artemia franciscana]|uniref:Otopetrin n=1 Tax=Artemia franciscana TaxID=6661 RepID=A0AA88L3W4_ARTSF|nr:hypothetical protein QYM36_006633 [Artemia franciscana]
MKHNSNMLHSQSMVVIEALQKPSKNYFIELERQNLTKLNDKSVKESFQGKKSDESMLSGKTAEHDSKKWAPVDIHQDASANCVNSAKFDEIVSSAVSTPTTATTIIVLHKNKYTQTEDLKSKKKCKKKCCQRHNTSYEAPYNVTCDLSQISSTNLMSKQEKHNRTKMDFFADTKKEKTFEELWIAEWKEAHLNLKNRHGEAPERDSLDGQLPGSLGPGPSGESPGKLDKEKGEKKPKKAKKKKEDMTLDMPPIPLPGMTIKKAPSMIGGDGWGGPTEPCNRIWVTLSSLYGRLLVVLTFAFCLTETMDNKLPPFHFQGVYLVYLYVGSIISILTIYVAILLDSCPIRNNGGSVISLTGSNDPESGSIKSFGSLRKAHLNKNSLPRTSFYLRIGALVFGLISLVFSGLEIAMHSTLNSKCVYGDLAFAHPVLQALFTFLQMHFLFVNSEVLLQKFHLVARFGLMHLMATNVSLWVRTIVWESSNEWYHFLYHQHNYGNSNGGSLVGAITARLRGFMPDTLDDYYDYEDTFDLKNTASNLQFDDPLATKSLPECKTYSPISEAHVQQMISLYQCFNNNTLGRSWTASMPYLFPFLVEYKLKIEVHFGLIAAVAMYVIWRSVGSRSKSEKRPSDTDSVSGESIPRSVKQKWRVDCQSSSIGLFIGLLCFVAAIIVSIIFFVMKDNLEFRNDMFWICTGTQVSILSVCIVMSIIGILQLPKLSPSGDELTLVDRLLQNVTVSGAIIFTIFGTIVGAENITNPQHSMTLVMNVMIIVQVILQHAFMSELSVRACLSRYQMAVKPGRQVVMFLLVVNAALWLLDSFITHSWATQEFHFTFYGILTWGVISRITLPFLVFYRFHSAVVLTELWKNCFRTDDN